MTHPFEKTRDGIKCRIRVQPNARQNRIQDIVTLPDGQTALKIAVTAVPEDGKANQAVTALLSKTWKIPKSAITLQRGQTVRNKVFLLDIDEGKYAALCAEFDV